MALRGTMTLAIVTGGIALGAILGAAANPKMKMPAERPWQGALLAPVAADPGYRIMVEAPPEDLSPYPDSYAPTWAREELADWEPDYPAWSYSDLVDEPSAEPPATQEAQAGAQPIAVAGTTAEPPAAIAQAAEPAVSASERHVPANLAALY
jgi:hypothetical protein